MGIARKITAVIPTKSNINGALHIIGILEDDPMVEKIVLVADGAKAYKKLKSYPSKLIKTSLYRVKLGSGIHVMWNIGLDVANYLDTHIAFINDDVTSDPDTAGKLSEILSKYKSVGLVCPNYDGREIKNNFISVDRTCEGRYDGTGGLAGFYMAFNYELAKTFRFDERMKWWYGDDDIIQWTKLQGKRVVITSLTNCSGNESKTTFEDPPPNFANIVGNDKLIYEEKWGIKNDI